MISREVEDALRSQTVMTLSMALTDEPYAVPVSYGYSDGHLYFHGSLTGRKISTLLKNPRVCFSIVVESSVKPADLPCQWSTSFRSVVGFGSVQVLQDPLLKCKALNAVMTQHCKFNGQEEPSSFEYGEAILLRTAVFSLKIGDVTLKVH